MGSEALLPPHPSWCYFSDSASYSVFPPSLNLPYPSHGRASGLPQTFGTSQSQTMSYFPVVNHKFGALASFLASEANVDHYLSAKQLSPPSPFMFYQDTEHYLIMLYVLLTQLVFLQPSLHSLSIPREHISCLLSLLQPQCIEQLLTHSRNSKIFLNKLVKTLNLKKNGKWFLHLRLKSLSLPLTFFAIPGTTTQPLHLCSLPAK